MSGVGLPDSSGIAPRAVTNGLPRPPKKNGAAVKRSAATSAPADAPLPLAGPAAAVAAAVDAPMWPVHSAAWFQPEASPAPPAWSGLAIERHARVAAPDFLVLPIAPVNRAAACDHQPHARAPVFCPEIPDGSLTPLGWDPRTVCRKEPTA